MVGSTESTAVVRTIILMLAAPVSVELPSGGRTRSWINRPGTGVLTVHGTPKRPERRSPLYSRIGYGDAVGYVGITAVGRRCLVLRDEPSCVASTVGEGGGRVTACL